MAAFSRSAIQLQKREQRAQMDIEAGLVSEHYPNVSKITLVLTYYQVAAMPVLMVRTINFLPHSVANFKMNCAIPGCEGGGFDLTKIIATVVKGHKKTLKGKLACKGKNEAFDKNHASIDYEIIVGHKNSLN
jgi:hypothetical protein